MAVFKETGNDSSYCFFTKAPTPTDVTILIITPRWERNNNIPFLFDLCSCMYVL